MTRSPAIGGVIALVIFAALPSEPEATPTPAAPSAVRTALCEAGAVQLRVGDVTVNAAASCGFKIPNPNGYVDVLLGPGSLATQQVCDGWAANTPCPDNNSCTEASAAPGFICRCGGAGKARLARGLSIDGLFLSWRGLSPGSCPEGAHNGCAILLTMTKAQWHVLRAVALDDDTDAYPAGIKAIVDAMRDDPNRAQRRADVPACMRSEVPVRMGRTDIDGAADEVSP